MAFRTKIYSDIVNKGGSDTWWKWIMTYKLISCSGHYAAIGEGYQLDWSHLAANQNTSLDIIKANLDEFISKGAWSWILKNPNITIEFIEEYINRINPVDSCAWLNLTLLPVVTTVFIENNPQYPWHYSDIAEETLQFGVDNDSTGYSFKQIDDSDPEYVNWDDVSIDTFNQEKQKYFVSEYRRYLSAYRIQCWWRFKSLRINSNSQKLKVADEYFSNPTLSLTHHGRISEQL